MGKFQQAIIHGKVYAPNSIKFSSSEWINQYDILKSDEVDDSIYEYGLIASRHIELIRSAISKITPANKDVFLKYFSGLFNHNLISTQKQIMQTLSTSDGQLQFGSSYIPVKLADGGITNEIAAFENIFLILKASSWTISQMNSENEEITENQFSELIKQFIHLSKLYNKWMSVSSGAYQYNKQDGSFKLFDTKEEYRKDIARLRKRDKKRYHMLPANIYQDTESTTVIGYDFTQNKLILRPAKQSDMTDFQKECATSKLMLNIFSREQLGGLGGVTIGDLLHVYKALLGLREDLAKKYFEHKNPTKFDDLLKFKHTINRKELIESLSQVTPLTKDQIENAIKAVCFTFDRAEDPAANFFLPTSEGLIPFLPTMYPQLDFLISYWLSRGKAKINRKGAAFEKYIRKELTSCGKHCDIVVHPSTIMFKSEKAKEEIDLAFIFGSNLFVCELKFFQRPTDDVTYYSYIEKIKEAASQAERKKAFVSEKIKEFISRYFQSRRVNKIYSIVITGQFECSGEKINDTLIIDSNTLLDFFSVSKPNIPTNNSTPFEKIILENIAHKLYYTSETASNDFIKYIENPPQIRTMMDEMKTITYQEHDNITSEMAWRGDSI